MLEVKVTKNNKKLQIKWQLSTIEIPLSDITAVANDETYAGKEITGMRIGFPYGNTDRVIIQTKTDNYIIFTSIGNLKDKIMDFIKEK
ncbi:SunI/YnzG family protein [Niallia circulans]|uniref:SunI/YnzG family protein n=1 Tax=Niallia circulans TaxID=1397 RepID=UPI0026EBDC74|nr:PH domain-containing protein [Niallia circulans]